LNAPGIARLADVLVGLLAVGEFLPGHSAQGLAQDPESLGRLIV
jgi:hypothetical protein